MKYIRTKDGRIIDLNSKLVSSYQIIDDKTAIEEYGEDSGFVMVYYYNRDIGEHIEYDNKGGSSMDNWYLKDIIKKADTIEELCDEFVYFAEELYDIPISVRLNDKIAFAQAKSNFKLGCECGFKNWLKLAIWTDKGLIYVAKMNEKGELELL